MVIINIIINFLRLFFTIYPLFLSSLIIFFCNNFIGKSKSVAIAKEKHALLNAKITSIKSYFVSLKYIYKICNEECEIQGMEYTPDIESWIPMKDDIETKTDDKNKNTESYRLLCEQRQALREVKLLNSFFY